MRVLLVNMSLDTRLGGGTAVRTRELARALAATGTEVTVATVREGDPPVLADLAPAPVVALPAIGGRFRVPRGGWRRLERAVGAADVVLLMNHWTAINALVARAARRRGRPWVVSPAGALPVVGRARLAKRLYDLWVGRRLVRGAAGRVAVTADEVADFARFGIAGGDVAVIPNGVEPVPAGDAVAFRRQHRLGERPVVLFLGRLAPIKGPDLLLEGFLARRAELGDAVLVLAGPDDGSEASLRERVAEADAGSQVLSTGFLAGGAKAAALAAADLVVVPSRREAMSIVVLEAGAARKPVLVTDRCGVPEVAETGGGWIVPVSAEALGQGLVTALADREELRRRGDRWRQVVLERYTWEAAARRHLDLFARVLGR